MTGTDIRVGSYRQLLNQQTLIKNLGLGFNAKDIQHAKYCFINITHPSARIGADKLFEEMNMEEVFGARLKKGNPVCVDKFDYY